MRRNIGRHTHGNASRAIDQQVGQACRQCQGFLFGAVIVGAEIDGFLVDVSQHFVGNLGQANFGVSHGRCAVAVHRSEVTLAVHQHVAQREVLGHAHDGVVYRAVAVWVVLTNYVTHDTGRLLVGAIPIVVELVHCIQHATMHRL